VCELLQNLPGWEAIKLTRGHYRSCGRDPEACCVSDLLADEPVVRSGREANYEQGKDTGRFWDAGASNVHWVIVTDGQVKDGIEEAFSRVRAEGVIIEGNSFLEFVRADLTIMCARSAGGTIKTSAREVLTKTDLLYLSSLNGNGTDPRQQFSSWRRSVMIDLNVDHLPVITQHDLPQLVSSIKNRNYPHVTRSQMSDTL